jgi:hypothetical protein
MFRLSTATFAVSRITFAAPRAIAFCPFTVHAGTFTPAWVTIAALGSRTIRHDLGIQSGLAGKVRSRSTPNVTAIHRAGSDRSTQQDDKAEAPDGPEDILLQVRGHH